MTPPNDSSALARPRLVRVSSSPLAATGGARPAIPAPGPTPARQRIGGPHLRLVTREGRRRRTSPVLALVALTVIAALFGLAAFHNLMATAQYDLERLERELELEQARLVDLEYQVEQLNAPGKVEQLARGALGMIDPTDAVDLVVDPALLAEVHLADAASREAAPGADGDIDWATLKPLLGAS